MPIYCYKTESGEIFERKFEWGKAPPAILVDGVEAKRDYRSEGVGVPSTSGWPIICYASGVNARDAGALRDVLSKKGVPTEVTPDGDPIYTSAVHRRRALRARGFHDRAGYD
jgi:hypothetical protein